MRCKEAREFEKTLRLVYDPVTKERHNKTHKPLFPKPADIQTEPLSTFPTALDGSTPATVSQIRHVLYKREDDIQ
jgi:hypothetical protein